MALRILSCAQMKAAEAAAVQAGTSYEQLMENAGRGATDVLLNAAGTAPSSVLLLCGRGNNAGDAFVVARLLAAQNWQVEVLPLCGEAFSPLAQLNFQRLPQTVRHVTPLTANYDVRWLVDGVFGTGFSGRLPQAVRTAFGRANCAAGTRVALDLPSGLNGDTGEADQDTFRAALTFTFGALKPALALASSLPFAGETQVLDIGL